MQQQSTTSTPVVCPRGTSAYTWQEGDTLESVARDRGITAQSMTLAPHFQLPERRALSGQGRRYLPENRGSLRHQYPGTGGAQSRR